MTRLRVLSPSRRVQNFTPIGAEMAELNSFFEIAIASPPHRNAMRARYKDRCQKSTNGVGVVTFLHKVNLGMQARLTHEQIRLGNVSTLSASLC